MDKFHGKNILPKIVALIVAVVLWMYVTNEQNPPAETSLSVPLEVRNVSSALTVLDAPDVVRIKVRGSHNAISELQASDTKFYVDLGDYSEGWHSVQVYGQMPAGVELLEVYPKKVSIRLDTVVSRKMPAEIRLDGTAAAGTAVAKVVASPEQVTIEGPRSMVDTVAKMQLPLDLNNRNADFTASVKPIPLDRDGSEVSGLTVNPGRVKITANLVQGLSKKIVEIRPIIYGYGELAPGMALKGVLAKPDKIEISGDPQTLDKLDHIYTEPVNVAGLSKDTVKEAKLQLKTGVLASQATVLVEISVSH